MITIKPHFLGAGSFGDGLGTVGNFSFRNPPAFMSYHEPTVCKLFVRDM